FDSSSFDRGRPAWVEALWWVAQRLFFRSWVPGSTHRAWLLRRFGARIGRGVVLKPGVRVKFPWRLKIADHVWIGEDVWIDNLATVTIRDHCCISQGAYLCTGSHDWESATFNLITEPIEIREFAWVGARAVVGPGVVVSEGAVLALGSVATENLDSWQIYQGVPAQPVRSRRRLIDRSDGVDTGSSRR
ncbi:MAG: colanic acid biosynthesis acetyltransferase WcaF, partial [Gemmatimonadales bacterium]|nr:colanic acid biosynthesis acetyltransferase WcaF [Gemmatimonadales bacterium]